MGLRFLAVALVAGLAGCSQDDGNMMASGGDGTASVDVNAALGPEPVAEDVGNLDSNAVTADNATGNAVDNAAAENEADGNAALTNDAAAD
ncbi:hypothetical protein H8M03_05255 [Sphingomonas sabuli]|uniref:Uncharacterized protein n=1 Tax=Sphingomonas sabuli TaxID=2764186 RepID=A0A7G9L531_9SPHN|nr:hypothetical protein [Sphingomonas sabuli]QNM83730.1 hypothetical protein H8M03_05255 [Sphingomonas sabuli]